MSLEEINKKKSERLTLEHATSHVLLVGLVLAHRKILQISVAYICFKTRLDLGTLRGQHVTTRQLDKL